MLAARGKSGGGPIDSVLGGGIGDLYLRGWYCSCLLRAHDCVGVFLRLVWREGFGTFPDGGFYLAG